jgi:hypothetical protein
MSRYPGATWAPLPEASEGGKHVKTQLVFHSTGTRASAAANRQYFARAEVKVESTLIVDYDGGCLQVMETWARAQANGTANRRGISVEVVGVASEPYTPAQVERCLDIARWACDTNPIARRQIPAERESGIGWHVMFGAPGPWTSARGKQCPGRQRIAQVRDVLIPTITGDGDGIAAAVPEEVSDMVLVVCPGKPLCLLAHGRLWPLKTNAQGQAYLAAGVPRQDVEPEEWDQLDDASKHLAALGA